MLNSRSNNFYRDKSRNFDKLYYYTYIVKFIKIEDNIELKKTLIITNLIVRIYFILIYITHIDIRINIKLQNKELHQNYYVIIWYILLNI